HQYLAQLRAEVLDAVVGNVGSMISFRVGHDDANALERAFGSAYPARQFTSLNNGEVCAKLLSNGEDGQPFVGRTLPPQGRTHGRREAIIHRSRERFAEKRSIIEERINRWLV